MADLNTLKRDPAQLDALAFEALNEVLEECATDLVRVAVIERRALARLAQEMVTSTHGSDRLLGVKEAAERLSVTQDWLRRRPYLPFVVKLSEGTVRYSSNRIDAYIAEHCQK